MSKPEPAPDRWNLGVRIPRTVRVLSSASEEAVKGFIWDRLSGKPVAVLPPLEFREMPADLFVDVFNETVQTAQSHIAELIARCCAELLDRFAERLRGISLAALSELIYLAGRIESEVCIMPLTNVAEADGADEVLPNNETVRLRCMRALVPSLAKFPSQLSERHRTLFHNTMLDRASSLVAVTGLVALFHEDQAVLLHQLDENRIPLPADRLQVSLEMIGAS